MSEIPDLDPKRLFNNAAYTAEVITAWWLTAEALEYYNTFNRMLQLTASYTQANRLASAELGPDLLVAMGTLATIVFFHAAINKIVQ